LQSVPVLRSRFTGTPHKNVALVQKPCKTSVEWSFFVECVPGRGVLRKLNHCTETFLEVFPARGESVSTPGANLTGSVPLWFTLPAWLSCLEYSQGETIPLP
jgi:hypothetical protein